MHPEQVETKATPGGLFRNILFATDLSPASDPAFDQSIRLAKETGAHLWIAHAYDIARVIDAGFVSGVDDEWDARARTGVETRLGPLVDRARSEGVEADRLVVDGAPDVAIVEAAQERGADLIVMGTHGRRGFSRLFLGSVASRVIASAPCPVMSVRATAPE